MRSFHPFYIYPFLFGFTLAQNSILSLLPDCATQCFKQEASISSCSVLDINCLCADPAFIPALQTCKAANCTVKEILTSTNVTLSACGVPTSDVSNTIIGISASFGSLAMLLFLVRIADRFWVSNVSLVSTIITPLHFRLSLIEYKVVKHGLGKDIWTLSFPDINTTLKLLYVAEVVYFPAEMFTQLSILAFYRRVFAKSSSVTQKGSIIMMVVVVLFGIANTLAIIFQCTPIPFFWSGWSGEVRGSCININLFSWIRAAVEIAVDIAILSLPLRDISKLQLSWRKKAQVLLVFVLGFVITVVSVVRLQSLIQFSETTNITHDNAPAVYWSVLECDVFIIAACLPSLRSILSRLMPRRFRTTQKGGSGSNSSESRKYYRQDDADSSKNPSSYHSQPVPSPGFILKRVDLHISHESGATADEIELLRRQTGHAYVV
ncbi:hypothetical protein EV127DRAFT_457975 [Xylaria flabelliformis]|nr:hypothetical protein EV127DRAFT_457975 [Xylaria flabelliformis]